MNKETHFHLLHYLILIIIMGVAVVLFFSYQGNPGLQLRIAVGASGAYFLWGVVHHKCKGDLYPKIVVEYLLIAILAIILLKGAIYK